MKPRILYAEDDNTLAFLTQDSLEMNGYDVVHVSDGKSCLDAFAGGGFDLCILDIMLPKADGFEIAAQIRNADTDVPIIFLSAKTMKEDRLKGLRLGADDYLVKPFSIEELLLKIDIFLKRSRKAAPARQMVSIGGLQVDFANLVVRHGQEKTALTQREADLLALFLQHPDQILKRETILKALWGDDDYFMGRSLDVFISRLRKILAPAAGVSIENIHGIGFRLHTEP
jgi:DNA-binding response OmpR family regulator